MPPNPTHVRALAALVDSIDETKRSDRRLLYGANAIVVPFRAMGVLVEQVLHPFYVFQILSIILWALWDYWSYLSVILLLSLGSLAIEFYEVRCCVASASSFSSSLA